MATGEGASLFFQVLRLIGISQQKWAGKGLDLFRVLECFNLSSSPPTRGRGRRKLIGKGVCGPV